MKPSETKNEMKANETKQNESVAPTSVSKERMEELQTKHATAIGCDARKAVSGFEYLIILCRALVEIGAMPVENLPLAASACKGMKANNSALRQWLYERAEKADKPSAIAEKYLNM